MIKGKNRKIDPITFVLIKNSISSIIDQMALTMNRTSYSPLVRDLFDFATGLCNAEGDIIGEGLVNPVHTGVFSSFIKVLRKIWKNQINPGDVFMCNDPYEGASHIPDVYTVRPVFYDGELIAFSGAIAHQLDFGGKTPGSNACDNIEIFQEGLRIPPIKYYDRGERNLTLYTLIKKNVRISHKVIGDLESQVAALAMGESAFIALVKKYGGWQVVKYYINELLDYSEHLTRTVIRGLPDGEYEFEDYMDDDGFSSDPVRLYLKITIKDDQIVFDFTGSSPQVKGSINLPFASTVAIVNTALRLFLDSSIPSNSGVWRPVTLIAPPGTITHASFPAGVAGRGGTLGRLWDVCTGCLGKVAPDMVPACTSNVDFGICMGGNNRDGEPFVFTDFLAGSWGGRPFADGIDGHPPLWLNYSNIPCEVIEKEYPLRIEQYGYLPDTGGVGMFRGGLGMIREYSLETDTVVQWRQDRALFPPWGLNGGKAGSLAKGYHITDEHKRVLKKESFSCKKGDKLQAILPGAGGWGDPYKRDLKKVLQDVRDRKISIDAAEQEYGVVINKKTLEIEVEATKKLRIKTGIK
jgi:N-methylhydantoinase B